MSRNVTSTIQGETTLNRTVLTDDFCNSNRGSLSGLEQVSASPQPSICHHHLALPHRYRKYTPANHIRYMYELG